ncbi:MAG: hypothetical protein U0441_29555 [Polyangiaceae bacterium]
MPKPNPKQLLRVAGNYLKSHPEEIWRAVKGATGLRFGLPMDALRYLIRELATGEKAPKDIVIEAAPPGLRASLTVSAMGTPLRVSVIVFVEEIEITLTAMKFVVRLQDLSLKVLGDANTPIAGFIKSGALDLSKPANLVNIMPKKPALLIDAKDDRITLDLMKLPKIAENPRVKRALPVALPVVGLSAIQTKDDHLDLHLKLRVSGVPEAIAAARATV